jgi:hypothetical protein
VRNTWHVIAYSRNVIGLTTFKADGKPPVSQIRRFETREATKIYKCTTAVFCNQRQELGDLRRDSLARALQLPQSAPLASDLAHAGPDRSCSAKAKVAQVDRNHDPLAHRPETVVAHIGASLSRQTEPVHIHDVVDILSGREASRYVDMVVVAPLSRKSSPK